MFQLPQNIIAMDRILPSRGRLGAIPPLHETLPKSHHQDQPSPPHTHTHTHTYTHTHTHTHTHTNTPSVKI